MADQEGAKPRKKAAKADPAAPPRVRRSYLRAPERRAQIIAAAQQVFAQSNLKGARTRDIAKAAKVTQATLFEHFASKEELFEEAVVKPLLDTMRGMTEASTTRRPSTPRTRRSGSTTAPASVPARQVPAGWWTVMQVLRMCSSI